MTSDDHVLLERNELLRNVDFEIIDYILNECLLRTVSSGEKLLEIGKNNNTLYLILDGELHVYLDNRDLTEHAVLGAGQCVGELSLIDGGNASALVVAARDTRVLIVPHEYVWSLVDNANGVARNLLSILSGRIRSDNLLRVTTNERSLVFEVAKNVDALTGLHNRGWMDDAFPRMMLRCERDQLPLCLLLADIDDFKFFCRTYGQAVGDSVLKVMAKALAEKLRPQDLLVYVGGDKFAVLLPETPLEETAKIAERLREEISMSGLLSATNDVLRTARTQLLNQDTRITISIGIVAMQPGESLNSMFATAHMALYQAKGAGKNLVRVAAGA